MTTVALSVTTDESLAAVTPAEAERALIAQALDGDGRAFSALVRPHLAMLYRIAARACGDRTLAEDAVQETLTLAYQRLAKVREGTSFKAYLAGIAVRRAHTLLRGERRRKVREEVADAPQRSATPEQLASAADLARRLRAVLDRMPKKRRAAAMLRLEGGLSHAEIAQALGSTEGSARVLVHLALKELKAHLAEEAP